MYKSKDNSSYGIYLYFVHLLRNKVNHLQASLSDKEWAISYTQPDFFGYEVVSLVIRIDQDLLARW